MLPKVIEKHEEKHEVVLHSDKKANTISKLKTAGNITKKIFNFLSTGIIFVCKVIGWCFRFIKSHPIIVSPLVGLITFFCFFEADKAGTIVIAGVCSFIYSILSFKAITSKQYFWLFCFASITAIATLLVVLANISLAHYPIGLGEALEMRGLGLGFATAINLLCFKKFARKQANSY